MNRGPETFCSVLPFVSGRAVMSTRPPKSSPHKPHRVITPCSHEVCKSGVTGEVALNRSLGIIWSLSSFCLIHVLWQSYTSPSSWKQPAFFPRKQNFLSLLMLFKTNPRFAIPEKAKGDPTGALLQRGHRTECEIHFFTRTLILILNGHHLCLENTEANLKISFPFLNKI